MGGLLRIVIPGGSGQVGTLLARRFHAQGHAVTVLARHPRPQLWRTVPWDGIQLGDWTAELEDADAVINLAGRSVNCRYTPGNRAEIKESRVRTTRLVGEAIRGCRRPPRLWMNASTATIYRHALDRVMDEATGELGGNEIGVPDTWRFSIDVAKSWEDVFFSEDSPDVRKIALRSAMVMSPDRGGIFDTLRRLASLGLGGQAGDGRQFVSWVHEEDFVRAIEFLIADEELEGAVNVAAPNPLPNSAFMKALREAFSVHVGLPATRWMLEMGAVFMRTETELILKSRRVVPGRLLQSGFDFEFPTWPNAAEELAQRWLEGRAEVRPL